MSRFLLWPVAALLLAGCGRLVSDYQVSDPVDAADDRDSPDGNSGDAGLQPACTPASAGPTFAALVGPLPICDGDSCHAWRELCLSAEHQYLLQQVDGVRVRWYDRCIASGLETGECSLDCASVGSQTVSIGINRTTISDPAGFRGSWTLFHRRVDLLAAAGPASGCPGVRCELLSAFDTAADDRPFVRQHVDGTARWFEHCRSESGDLVCGDGLGNTVRLRPDGVDTGSVNLDGDWTLLQEPTAALRWQGPTDGCAEAACPLWDTLVPDSAHRYAVRLERDGDTVWFGACAADLTDPADAQLACSDPDGRELRLHATGPETISAGAMEGRWTLLRWPLALP